MKTQIKSILIAGLMALATIQLQAQKSKIKQKTIAESQIQGESKEAYYNRRAQEDAAFEQQYVARSEADAELFWENQEDYEKNLKKTDRKAYRAYMKGKRDAYRDHQEVCDAHCRHDHHYHDHVAVYYYNEYRPAPRPTSTRISTGVRIGVPRIGIGF